MTAATGDRPEPPTNPRLLVAMEAAARSADSAVRSELMEALARAVLTVPLRSGPSGQEYVAHAGKGAGPLLFAFTDGDALRRWARGDQDWGALRTLDLARTVLELGPAGLRINPSGPHGGTLGLSDVATLAEVDIQAAKDGPPGSMMVHEPQWGVRAATGATPALAERLTQVLQSRTDLSAVYLLESTGSGAPHTVLGLVLDAGTDPDPVVQAIGESLRKVTAIGTFVDIMELSLRTGRSPGRRGAPP